MSRTRDAALAQSERVRLPGLHNILEMRMISEEGAVDGDHDVLVVHLLEQGSDARRGHERGAPRNHLADVSERGRENNNKKNRSFNKNYEQLRAFINLPTYERPTHLGKEKNIASTMGVNE